MSAARRFLRPTVSSDLNCSLIVSAGFVVGVLVYAGTGLLRSRRQRPGVLPRRPARPRRLPLWEIVGAVTIWGALLGVGAALARLITTGDWLPLALVIAFGLACWFMIWTVMRDTRAGRGGGALSVTLVALLLAGCTGPFPADLRQCARPSAAARTHLERTQPEEGRLPRRAYNPRAERKHGRGGGRDERPARGSLRYMRSSRCAARHESGFSTGCRAAGASSAACYRADNATGWSGGVSIPTSMTHLPR